MPILTKEFDSAPVHSHSGRLSGSFRPVYQSKLIFDIVHHMTPRCRMPCRLPPPPRPRAPLCHPPAQRCPPCHRAPPSLCPTVAHGSAHRHDRLSLTQRGSMIRACTSHHVLQFSAEKDMTGQLGGLVIGSGLHWSGTVTGKPSLDPVSCVTGVALLDRRANARAPRPFAKQHGNSSAHTSTRYMEWKRWSRARRRRGWQANTRRGWKAEAAATEPSRDKAKALGGGVRGERVF
jgi:hypothetical protein